MDCPVGVDKPAVGNNEGPLAAAVLLPPRLRIAATGPCGVPAVPLPLTVTVPMPVLELPRVQRLESRVELGLTVTVPVPVLPTMPLVLLVQVFGLLGLPPLSVTSPVYTIAAWAKGSGPTSRTRSKPRRE